VIVVVDVVSQLPLFLLELLQMTVARIPASQREVPLRLIVLDESPGDFRGQIEDLHQQLVTLIDLTLFQPERVDRIDWVVTDVGVEVSPANELQRVLAEKSPGRGVKIPRAIVIQPRSVALTARELRRVGSWRA